MLTKKKMLVPLRMPATPAKKLGVGDVLLNWTGQAAIFFFKICFGWLGWILSRISYRKFTGEIRRYLPFLFEEHHAYFLPEERSKYALVANIAFGAVRLKLSRHHGEFYVSLSSEFTPGHWEDFDAITSGFTQWGSVRRETYQLETFEPTLRKYLPLLEQILSKKNAESTMDQAIERHNASVEAYAERARTSGVEPIFLNPNP